MFGFFAPRYYHRSYRHGHRHGMGRSLLWGLLIGPWLFRKLLGRGSGYRRGGGWGGPRRDTRYV